MLPISRVKFRKWLTEDIKPDIGTGMVKVMNCIPWLGYPVVMDVVGIGRIEE
jgi:hypothetical protein